MAIHVLEDNQERIKEFKKIFPDIVINETSQGFIEDLKANHSLDDVLYLDHDLGLSIPGQPNSGMDVVRYLEEHHVVNKRIFVHSLNPYAAKVMVSRLRACGYNAFLQPYSVGETK